MRLFPSLILAAVLLVGGRVAVAQPSADDKKAAKAAFKRAEAAEARKDWQAAIDEYQIAYDLIPHPDVLANIAIDLEHLEKYRDAANMYLRYLDEGSDAEDRDRVEKLIAALRARPGTLTVTSEPTGAAVAVDGQPAGDTPLEIEISGTHHLEVVAGESSETRTVTIEFGEPQTVHIPLVVEPVGPGPGGNGLAETDTRPSENDQVDVPIPSQGNRTRKIAGVSATAVGVVSIVVSLGLGLSAKREYARATDVCGIDLDCTTTADYDDARTHVDAAKLRGNVASVIGGLGLVATVGGVILWLTTPSRHSDATQETAVRIVPQIGLDDVGLVAVGAF